MTLSLIQILVSICDVLLFVNIILLIFIYSLLKCSQSVHQAQNDIADKKGANLKGKLTAHNLNKESSK